MTEIFKPKEHRYEIEVSIQPVKPDDTDEPTRYGGASGQYFFPPLGKTVRGRFSMAHYANLDGSVRMKAFGSLGEIPGQRIWCDLAQGMWGTYDPLKEAEEGSPESRLAERIVSVMSRHFTGGHPLRFVRKTESQLFTLDDRKNVLYWMARAVEAKYCVVVTGFPKLPSSDDIKRMVGKRSIDHRSKFINDDKVWEKLKPMEFEVLPPTTKKEAASAN